MAKSFGAGFLASAMATMLTTLPVAGPVQAAPYEITDGEGFGELITALTVELPEGWLGNGRVAWLKPCSGNDMYEIIFNAAPPDGQSGFRMMPGHKLVWTEARVNGVDPYMAQFALAQNEQSLADMRRQFKASNCHVGRVQTTEDVLRTLILPKRPAGATVTRTQQNAALIAQFKAGFGAVATPGMITTYDAVVADIAYDGPQGPMVERMWLSWYRFADDPRAQLPGIPSIGFETTVVESVAFAYAPAARAQDLDLGAGILASARNNPVWSAKVLAEQKKRAEEQRRIQAERQAAIEAAGRAQHRAETAGQGIPVTVPFITAPDPAAPLP